MSLRIGAVGVLLGTLALAGGGGAAPAANPDVQAITALFQAGKLVAAEAELRRAQAREGTGSVDLGQLSILEGMIKVVSAEDGQARAAFRRALALDPQARLPGAATGRSRRMFDEIRAEARAGGGATTAPPAAASTAATARNLPAEFEQHCSEGKLPAAAALLDAAGARKDLPEIERGQLLVLKGLLAVLQDLEKGAPAEAYRQRADDLEAVEARLAEATTGAQLSAAESAQFLSLRSSLLVMRGVLRAESGEADRARASFRKALELNPRARLPARSSAGVRRLFDEVKAGRKP